MEEMNNNLPQPNDFNQQNQASTPPTNKSNVGAGLCSARVIVFILIITKKHPKVLSACR